MSVLSALKEKFRRLAAVPEKTRRLLEGEDLLFLLEGARVTVVFHRYRAAGRSFRNKRETTWGSLGVSRSRIVGYALRKRIIHLPLNTPGIEKVRFSLIDDRVLSMEVDPSVFNENASGRLEVRYHTDRAREAYSLIRELIQK